MAVPLPVYYHQNLIKTGSPGSEVHHLLISGPVGWRGCGVPGVGFEGTRETAEDQGHCGGARWRSPRRPWSIHLTSLTLKIQAYKVHAGDAQTLKEQVNI